MAKQPRRKQKDMHQSGFLVRLPEAYRGPLEELKAATGCPLAVSVRRAVRAYLKEHGKTPPEE